MDTAVLFLACVVLPGVMTIRDHLSRAVRRAARGERELDAVIRLSGIQEEVPGRGEILAPVRQGKRGQAIRQYREATGADLVEAEQAVDRLT